MSLEAARGQVIHTLNQADWNWATPWQERWPQFGHRNGLGEYSQRLMVEATLQLLQGQQLRYAEISLSSENDDGPPTFELTGVADDRVVIVNGKIDESWPQGTLIPRRELTKLHILQAAIENDVAIGLRDQTTARVVLEYGSRKISLPRDGASHSAGEALAKLVPSLIADRMGAHAPADSATAALGG